MENLTQKDPVWRENGKAFVESVTRLLERLLDYRNVGQVGGLFFHSIFVSTFDVKWCQSHFDFIHKYHKRVLIINHS